MDKNGLFVVVLAMFIFTATSQAAPPESWTQWQEGLKEKFQKKFAIPTITHHIYLKDVGDQALISLNGRYPRFSTKCKKCQWVVTRLKGDRLQIENLKDPEGKKIVFLEKQEALVGEAQVYIAGFKYKGSGDIRVFLYSLAQKKLAQKRMRSFFEYEDKFRVQGVFNWLVGGPVAKIHRSDGTTKKMPVIGKIMFELNGKKQKLSVYNFEGEGDGFKKESQTMLLFRDLSNGRATYGAGRFMNVDFKKKMGDLKAGDLVTLDFNFSYNPPCATSTGFHCPLPQDMVELNILAGEKYKRI